MPETTPPKSLFDDVYAGGAAPWVIGEPQSAMVDLERRGAISGAVLDAGCGAGEHTILLAGLGYDVLGVDFSSRAVELARANAAARGVNARFEVAELTRLDGGPRFDTVVDSAHVPRIRRHRPAALRGEPGLGVPSRRGRSHPGALRRRAGVGTAGQRGRHPHRVHGGSHRSRPPPTAVWSAPRTPMRWGCRSARVSTNPPGWRTCGAAEPPAAVQPLRPAHRGPPPASRSSRSHSVSQTRRPIAAGSTDGVCPLRWRSVWKRQMTPPASRPSATSETPTARSPPAQNAGAEPLGRTEAPRPDTEPGEVLVDLPDVRELPVEDRGEPGVVDDQVAHPEVAVHQPVR